MGDKNILQFYYNTFQIYLYIGKLDKIDGGNLCKITPHPSFASQNPPSPQGEGITKTAANCGGFEFYKFLNKRRMFIYPYTFSTILPSCATRHKEDLFPLK